MWSTPPTTSTTGVEEADDNNDDDDDIIFKSAKADATSKHNVGVNSMACLGDRIAPMNGCDFTVKRAAVAVLE